MLDERPMTLTESRALLLGRRERVEHARGRCAAPDCRFASIPRTLMGEGGLGLQWGFNSLKAKPRNSGSYMLPGSTELEPRDYLKITREVACDCLAFA